MPHAVDFCRHLFGLSGSDLIVTHRGRQSTMAMLGAHAMEELFHYIIAGDDGYHRKTDPVAIEANLMENDLDKGETVAICDREIDAAAGKRAGLLTCILGRADENFTATCFVSNLDELKQIILSESAACVLSNAPMTAPDIPLFGSSRSQGRR